MLTPQTTTTVSPIRTDAELSQAHLWLDELLAVNAYDSPDAQIRDEFDVLTALIYYYEAHAITPQTWSLAGADVMALLEETLLQKQLTVPAAADMLQISKAELQQVLRREQPVSFTLAKRLHQRLSISAEALLTLPE